MIKVTTKSTEVQALFKQLGFNAEKLKPALVKIGGMLEDASEKAFNRQGPGWPALKKSTKEKLSRTGKGGKTLQRSGQLASSVSSQIRGNTVFIGSNLEYARVHQKGGTINHPGGTKYKFIGPGKIAYLKKGAKKFNGITKPHKIKIPKREYLILSEAELRKSNFILSKHMVRGT
jgi:phage virion morphogenesis protein